MISCLDRLQGVRKVNLSQYRLLQVGVLALTVLFGATACSKQKTEGTELEASAVEQTEASEVSATPTTEVEKQSADYYKADNKQRVAEENDLLDDVSAKK